MKFLLKIFILLAIFTIISAVQVERKHQKKHHARTKNDEVKAVLCDAGSSKTDCGCWIYDKTSGELKKIGDGVEFGGKDFPAKKEGNTLKNIFRLGDVFAAADEE